ncbi:MAG: ABC transporter substrate-binding protein [Bacillota bacterium]|nr:ABC transporter substrate-binding protein [Bacillota bacterium]
MRRNMRSLVFAVLLVFVLGVAAAAAPVKVTFWHSMGGDIGKAMEAMIDTYNASQSEVYVESVFRGTYPEVLNATIASAMAGTAPTVVQIYEVGSLAAIDSGVFVPLSEFIGPDDVDWNDYVDAVVNYYRQGDIQWSMPFNSSSAILYINADMFRAAGLDPANPPKTFSEIIEASKAIVESGVAPYGITWPLHTWFVEQWMAEQGVALVNNDNGRSARPTTINTDTEEMYRIFNWWKQLYDEGLWINPGVEDWDQANALFMGQQVAMEITSTSDVTFLTNAGREAGFEVICAELPVPDDVPRQGVVPGGASIWMVANNPKEELEAATKFLIWMSSPEQQVTWHQSTGYFPIRKSSIALLEEEGWFTENPNFRVALDQVLETIPGVGTQGALIGRFQEVRNILEEAFQMVMGGTSVEAALAQAKAQVEQSFADYNSLF